MKSDKLDLEFLLRAKNKSDQTEDEERADLSQDDEPAVLRNALDKPEDGALILPPEPESPAKETTSEFEISEEAIDLMWVLEKKKQKKEEESESEESVEAEEIETDEPELSFESESGSEWAPLILPEEPEIHFEQEEETHEFSLSDEDSPDVSFDPGLEEVQKVDDGGEQVQDDLKLIIEEIESHEKPENNEEPASPENIDVEFGFEGQSGEQEINFELGEENLKDSNKSEINALIDIIQPEATEGSELAFALENPDEPPTVPDITNMLRESQEEAELLAEEKDSINADLTLMPPVSESLSKKEEGLKQPNTSPVKPEAPGAGESAFSGFLKDQQQTPTGKGALPEKVKPKTKKQNSRFKKNNSFSFKELFESHSLLGLDIGTDSIKTVHLKKSGRSLKFINLKLSTNPFIDPEHTKEEKTQILATVLSKNFNIKDFKNAVIRTAISGMEVVFKNVQVPHMAKKELAKAVPWACRKDFPFPLESTVFDFKNITEAEKKGSKWDMFVVAAQKELISNHLNILGPSRILPAKISTIPEALWRAFQLGDKKDSGKCHILMDIGANSSHIVFINKGRLEFAREISTGGADFTNSLAGVFFVDGKETDISIEEAEKIKQKYGLPDEDAGEIITDEGMPLQELSVMMGPILERLISNVQRTIEFYKEKFKVEGITEFYLTGGGALMANLPEKLAGEINLAVKLFNPFDFISLKKTDNAESLKSKGPMFAVPVGLAVGKVNELNLLPPELKGSYTIEYLKKIYKYVFIIFVLVMAFLSQSIADKVSSFESEFRRLTKEFRNSEPMRKKYLMLQQTHQDLLAIKSRYGNSLESDIHAVNYLKIISVTIPKNITLTSLRIFFRKIKNEDANSKKKKTKKEQDVEVVEKEFVVLDGIAFENNSMEGMNLATFLLSLEKANFFETISLKSQIIREDGSLQFTIECQPFEAR